MQPAPDVSQQLTVTRVQTPKYGSEATTAGRGRTAHKQNALPHVRKLTRQIVAVSLQDPHQLLHRRGVGIPEHGKAVEVGRVLQLRDDGDVPAPIAQD
eukprot:364266-Chlamydomonas_euryale.AAC.13